MKKFLFILISVALATFLFAACQMNNSTDLGFLESGASSSVSSSSSETEKDSSSSETEKDSSSSEKEEDSSSSETEKEEDRTGGWSGFY